MVDYLFVDDSRFERFDRKTIAQLVTQVAHRRYEGINSTPQFGPLITSEIVAEVEYRLTDKWQEIEWLKKTIDISKPLDFSKVQITETTASYLGHDLRGAMIGAEVIIGIDKMKGQEFFLYGSEAYARSTATGKKEQLRIIRFAVQTDGVSSELKKLLDFVVTAKGSHQYQGQAAC